VDPAGRGVPDGDVVPVGVGTALAVGGAVGTGVGVGVGVGDGVLTGQTPVGATGGGSAPASGSYRNPTNSPSLRVVAETPCAELVQVPSAVATKNTQYEPEDGRQSV